MNCFIKEIGEAGLSLDSFLEFYSFINHKWMRDTDFQQEFAATWSPKEEEVYDKRERTQIDEAAPLWSKQAR